MCKIIIAGAAGRMGRAIIECSQEDPDIDVVSGIELQDNKACKDGNINGVSVTSDLSIINKADVLIDFTLPDAVMKNLSAAVKYGTPVVIGATGFSDDLLQEIKKVSNKLPICLAPNMSSGVYTLCKLAEAAAKILKGYDIEIVEAHHNKKKDAPSGTAVKLGEILIKASGSDALCYGREGSVGMRPSNEIGIHAVRAGDIVGEHTVMFAGPGERIELTHRAHSRSTFAAGALRAAKWIKGKKPGLYNIGNVLEKN